MRASDGLPATIPFANIEAVLAAIGVSADDCISLTFDVDCVVIEQMRTLSDGGRVLAGNKVSTVTTTIGYDREPL